MPIDEPFIRAFRAHRPAGGPFHTDARRAHEIFQSSTLSALLEGVYDGDMTYGELARRIGNPNASRAVGLANGSNPIPIIIPCHRVIGSNGKLTGYGGGLERKQFLLDLEAGVLPLLSA